MTDIILNTDDLTVFGPPASLDVNVGIGEQGTRGSKIFSGLGNPNLVSIGQTPNLNDWYINLSPGTEYSYMYEYVSEPGGNTWLSRLKFNPPIYSQRVSCTFTAGVGSVTIPIANIYTATGPAPTADDFVIQYSFDTTNPTVASIDVPALVGAGTDLVINFNGIQYSGGSWSALSGARTIHLFISMESG